MEEGVYRQIWFYVEKERKPFHLKRWACNNIKLAFEIRSQEIPYRINNNINLLYISSTTMSQMRRLP